MKLEQRVGNLLTQKDLGAIGHGVNCQGVMGAGIAKAFKQQWPAMHRVYKQECSSNLILPGKTSLYELHEEEKVGNIGWIANIASQDQPGADARYDWLEAGLFDACDQLAERGATSLGLPLIGGGIGGLESDYVIESLHHIQDSVDIQLVLVHFG